MTPRNARVDAKAQCCTTGRGRSRVQMMIIGPISMNVPSSSIRMLSGGIVRGPA